MLLLNDLFLMKQLVLQLMTIEFNDIKGKLKNDVIITLLSYINIPKYKPKNKYLQNVKLLCDYLNANHYSGPIDVNNISEFINNSSSNTAQVITQSVVPDLALRNNTSGKNKVLSKTKLNMSAQPITLDGWQTKYPAMYSLGDILLNKKKEFKFNRDAVNYAGASAWADKHGYNVLPEGTDINGDGVPDNVVITKRGGKPVMINGWQLDNSQFPLHNEFLNRYPTKQQQREVHGFNGFIHDLKTTNNGVGYEQIVNDWDELGYKVKKLTAYQIFSRFVRDYVRNFVRSGIKDYVNKNIRDPQQAEATYNEIIKRIDSGFKNQIIPYTTIISCHYINLLNMLWSKPESPMTPDVLKIMNKTTNHDERYSKFKSKLDTKKYGGMFTAWLKQHYNLNLNPSDVGVELSQFGLTPESLTNVAKSILDNNDAPTVIKQYKDQIEQAAKAKKEELIRICFNDIQPTQTNQ